MPYLIEPIALTQNTPFMILASDGLWNVMGNRAVQIANELKNKGKGRGRGAREKKEGREGGT